jgi:hypothetical protein
MMQHKGAPKVGEGVLERTRATMESREEVGLTLRIVGLQFPNTVALLFLLAVLLLVVRFQQRRVQ